MDNEATEFLTWQSADRSRTVRLSHDLIRKIQVEIMRGFGVTRRRGTEPGGVLLGRSEGSSLVVDGFQVVPCEYAFGPSYVLSPDEEPLFAEAVGSAGAQAVGFFRSHTRDGLTLDEADTGLFARHLRTQGRVALVLKPFATKPTAASLFFPDSSGQLHPGESPHEFPFTTKVDNIIAEPDPEPPAATPPTPPSPPPVAAEGTTAPAPALSPTDERVLTGVLGLRRPVFSGTLETYAEPVQETDASRRRGFATVLLGILFTAMALTTGFVAGVQVAGGRVSLIPPLVMRPQNAPVLGLGLRAEAAGERVRLTWSKASPAVLQSNGGSLYILEGEDSRVVTLRPEEVKDGSILHLPREAEVRFRLELNLHGDRTVTESVEWKR